MELDKLAAALVKFQGEVPTIPKNKVAKIKTKTGSDYSYHYADLADIWEAIREPLSKNGLAATQFLSSDEHADYIITKVWHESGQTDSEKFAIPTNGKTPQEVGSVITYYKRYALGAALGISTEEDDDGASGNSKPKSTPVVRNRPQEVAGGAEPFNEEADTLGRAKVAINEQMEAQGYVLPAQKFAIIQDAIGKTTIDNLDDCDSVADALDNLKEIE